MNLACIDLETTGTDVMKDRIVEIAIIKFDGENTIEKCYRINPGIPIPAAATEIHGIADADIADKPTFKQYARGILKFIEDCNILGYNSNSFDIPMLYAEFFRAGIVWDYSSIKMIDACTIFKRKEPRDLTASMKFYCNETYESAHSALTDARATLKVFAEQLRRYDITDEQELALYSNYDKSIIDLGGWFTTDERGEIVLAKGKPEVRGTQDTGFLRWMLTIDILPDARKICEELLNGK